MLNFPRKLHETTIMGIPTRKVVYVLVGITLAIGGFILLRGVPLFLRLPASLLIAAFSFLLAFGRLGGVDLDLFVIYYLKSLVSPRIYIWQKGRPTPQRAEKLPAKARGEALALPAPLIMTVNLVVLLFLAIVTVWGMKLMAHKVPTL